MAYDDGFYFGQCKLILEAETVVDEGRTVTVSNGSQTFSGVLEDKVCILTVPGRAQYTVTLLDGQTTKWSGKVECGYGECKHVMLADGYEVITANMLKDWGEFWEWSAEEQKKVAPNGWSLKNIYEIIMEQTYQTLMSVVNELKANFQDGVDRIAGAISTKTGIPLPAKPIPIQWVIDAILNSRCGTINYYENLCGRSVYTAPRNMQLTLAWQHMNIWQNDNSGTAKYKVYAYKNDVKVATIEESVGTFGGGSGMVSIDLVAGDRFYMKYEVGGYQITNPEPNNYFYGQSFIAPNSGGWDSMTMFASMLY